MKVLILNVNLGYGGAEKMLTFVANTLSQQENMEVTFLTYRENNAYQVLDERVTREHLQLESKGGTALGAIKSIFALHKYIKKNHFDVAIAFLTPSQIRLVPACWFTKTKVLLSQRADPFNRGKTLKRKILTSLNTFVFSMADYFVFQTKQAKSFYSKHVQRKCCVIPNPIHPLVRTTQRNIETDEKRFVTVSRLELKQKRQDLIIEAFKKFNAEYPEYVLDLFGSGPDEDYIRSLIDGNPHIRMCGVTRNVTESIQNATAFVFASDYEGIPNALMEAMSLGLPCVSTDCSPGGAALLIQNGENGYLVECGSAEKLYLAMKNIVENRENAETMGRNAMQINQTFSEDVIAQQWINAIDACMNADK